MLSLSLIADTNTLIESVFNAKWNFGNSWLPQMVEALVTYLDTDKFNAGKTRHCHVLWI